VRSPLTRIIVLPGELLGDSLCEHFDVPRTPDFPTQSSGCLPGDTFASSGIDIEGRISTADRLVAPSHAYAVDIRDAALLHVAVLLLLDVNDQRLFAFSTKHGTTSLTVTHPPRAHTRGVSITSSIRDAENDRISRCESDKAEDLLRRMGGIGWHKT
jgi:hypothetical protein